MAVDHDLTVALGDRSYPVCIRDRLDGLGQAMAGLWAPGRCVLVTDDHVAPLWAADAEPPLVRAGWQVHRVVVTAGEARKDRDTWWAIVDALLTAGVDRRTPVVALGGGVLGDLAGFAAASTLRGLPFVQVPTTLLAMVDSSVGGKTGFNHPRGKNLVGAFHQPALVWAAMETLSTLAPEERRAGLAEVVKAAVIADADLLATLEHDAEALQAGEPSVIASAVARSVAIKADVVADDEREAGRRAILNAGHTVGHAVEAVLGFGAVRHGEAVGIGLVCETAWAVREGLCDDPGLPARLASLLRRLGLPSALPPADIDALAEAIDVDKKVHGAMLTLPVVECAGHVVLHALPRSRARELLTR